MALMTPPSSSAQKKKKPGLMIAVAIPKPTLGKGGPPEPASSSQSTEDPAISKPPSSAPPKQSPASAAPSAATPPLGALDGGRTDGGQGQISSDLNSDEDQSTAGLTEKSSALYVFRPETSYLCRECAFLKDQQHCAFFGPEHLIKPDHGSCGYFTHAHPDQFPDMPYMGLFTPEELGYAESPYGFSCKRCEYFEIDENDCKKVDRNSNGDTPGEINPNACCSLWEADAERAGMPDEQLVQIINSSMGGAGATNGSGVQGQAPTPSMGGMPAT